MRLRIALALAFLVAFIGLTRTSPAQNPSPPDPVQIGLVGSLFPEANVVPEGVMNVFMKRFTDLMKDLTGFNGKATTGGTAFEIGKKLEDKQLHLGVFQGFEYAWVQQKNPNLKPLMIAVYYDRHLKASLVVHKANPATKFADLRGKDLALALGTKGHCRLFLERHCNDCAQCDSKAFFNQITQPGSTEGALDEVCGGTVQATIVDNVSLQTYQAVKPGCFNRLKVVKESEIFPAAPIVYRADVLTPESLDRFKQGLKKAHNTQWGKTLMRLFNITAFEDVPADYQITLTNIRKSYPAPTK